MPGSTGVKIHTGTPRHLTVLLFQLKAVAYVQISDEGQLKIIGTQELDAGEYRCVTPVLCGIQQLSLCFQLKAVAYVQISDEGQLKIIGTQELDAGEYQCEASHRYSLASNNCFIVFS